MKIKSFAVMLLAGVAIFSAQGAEKPKAENSKGTPSFAVKSFFTAMAKADFPAAKKQLMCKDLLKMITALEQWVKIEPELVADTKKEFANMANAKFISEKITGSQATVVISFVEKGKTKQQKYTLKKVNGNWLIEN